MLKQDKKVPPQHFFNCRIEKYGPPIYHLFFKIPIIHKFLNVSKDVKVFPITSKFFKVIYCKLEKLNTSVI